ncbi:hypothetical protein F4604DRAFT_1736623, partial [Suillus subluteus]
MNKRWEFLKKFELNFNHWFKFHLDCVQYYASSECVAASSYGAVEWHQGDII